ncbi:MAG: hypothetical protein ACRCXB_31280 [Aeromonadaceae bacterium]
MSKMRKEFEDWYLKQVDDDDVESIDLWDAWKASRATLCVELPYGYIGHPYRFDILSAVDDCRLALEDAGVEYK